MNEQRHKDRELAEVMPLGLFHHRPLLINLTDVCCPTSWALRLWGVHSPPHACADTCHSPSARALLPKTICNLFHYPNFKHRMYFYFYFQNTLSPHLQTQIQCLVWGAASLYSAMENPPATEPGCTDGSRELTEAIGDLVREGDADSEDTSEERTG